ncbi:hypothetical protein C8J57DRAFT_1490070 [Mycena rebaudengoi]|nr:hypothetical protein C8J57DRAFT_1490070 [Mycena rebaudengoi]
MSAVSVPETLGAMLLGGFFASLLSGVVNVQTVLYYRTYKTDPTGIKVLVLCVWALDNLHTAFIWNGLWGGLINNYGDGSRIDHIPWCAPLEYIIILTALVTFMVHCFFANRIFRLSRNNWYMTLPVVLLALLRLGSASVSTWEMYTFPSTLIVHAFWIFTLGLSVSSAVDVLIAGFLIHLFQSSRTDAGKYLNRVIEKLMIYAFETGSLTCLGTVISMICARSLSFPQCKGLHFVIGKLYANSLLVTLNTRENIRRARSTTSNTEDPVLFLDTRPQKSSMPYFVRPPASTQLGCKCNLTYVERQGGPSQKVPTELQVNVETSTSVQFDSEPRDQK